MFSKLVALTLLVAFALANFQLQVEKDGELGYFVRFDHYSDDVRVVYNSNNTAGCYDCELDVPYFSYDGNLWDTSVNLTVGISGYLSSAYHDQVLYTNASSPTLTAFSGFTICGGYLQHDGNSTFYTSNSYPWNKYIDFITTDSTSFLAAPVKLKVVNEVC